MSKLNDHTYLIKTLDLMRDDLEFNQRDEFFNRFNALKSILLEKSSDEVKRLYKNILRLALRKFGADPTVNTLLSAVVSLSNNLVPVEEFDEEIENLFRKCLTANDYRTRANALESMAKYDPMSEQFRNNINSQSNRIAGMALLIEAKKLLTPEITQKLQAFLSSSNPYFVASGVYVVSELTAYYMEKDLVIVETMLSPFFPKIRKYQSHPHEMIRKRALKFVFPEEEKKAA